MTYTVSDDGLFDFGQTIVTVPITGLSSHTPEVGNVVALTLSGGKVISAASQKGAANSALAGETYLWGVVLRKPAYEGQNVQVLLRGRVKVLVQDTGGVSVGETVRINYGTNAQHGVQQYGGNWLETLEFRWRALGTVLEGAANGEMAWVLFDGITGTIGLAAN